MRMFRSLYLSSMFTFVLASYEAFASKFDKFFKFATKLAIDCWGAISAVSAKLFEPTESFGESFGVSRQVHFNTEQPQSNRGRSSNLALGVFVHRTSLCM